MQALRWAAVALWLLAAAGAARPDSEPGEPPVRLNRLKDERSPYLRQHQTNPVDWYPWGEEAFRRARADEKPVFLSVGYAACHWCHVMEHESFEDEETAELLNAVFVPVKVDREERPDVDRLYMTSVQVFGRRGGWPMTVLLTPQGKPFWAGTYLPPEALRSLAEQVGRLWKEDRGRIEAGAERVAEQVRSLADGPDLPPFEGSDAEILHHLRNAIAARFDAEHGGYGTRPKFPPHAELLFFLDPATGASDAEVEQARRTLDAMADGGVHDHIGGGFHRYSTDERWLLPHFEKMLYDNALLASAYSALHARTGDPRYRRVVERIFGWLEREMARDGGGYASSLDADTQGEEGLTYTWTPEELGEVLGPDDYALAVDVFGVTEQGNFADEASGERTGRSILHLPRPLAVFAERRELEPAALRRRRDRIVEKLLAARSARPQPGLDDKVITGWNGLLLSAFARAGRDLGDARWTERARRLAAFLLERARREDGTLLRFPRGSGTEIPGFCEDHVHLAAGLLDLADATGEPRWAEAAEDLGRRLLEGFQDEEGGGFWTTSAAAHEALFARTKEIWDSPIPSDNGTAARVCLRLARRTRDPEFRRAADRTLAAFRPAMSQPRLAVGLVALFHALAERTAEDPGRGADVHVRQDVVTAAVFVEHAQIEPGKATDVLVRVTLDEGWHANAHEPGAEGLVALSVRAAEGAPAVLEDVRYPEPVRRSLGSLGRESALHEGTFEVRGRLRAPEGAARGPRKIPLVLTLQPCDESTCKAPVTVHLELALRFGSGESASRHPALFGAEADDAR